MEITRLGVALRFALTDLKKNAIVEKLTALGELANQAAQSPAEPSYSTAFTSKAAELMKVLRAASTNYIGPSARKVLEQTGFADLLSPNIRDEIEYILEATPFLLVTAAEQIRSIAATVKSKASQIEATIATLEKVAALPPVESLPPYELGVMLPKSLVRSDLRRINKELDEWIYVIDAISQLAHLKPRPDIELSSASQGSFEFAVKMDTQEAVIFLMIINGVLKIFTSVLSARGRREEMEKEGFPSKILDDMRKHEEELVDTAKGQVLAEVKKDPNVNHEAAKSPELLARIRHAIDWILKSMNVGVDVEVNANRPPTAADAQAEQRMKEMNARIDSLRLEVNRVTLSLPSREKPLLQLPAPSPRAEPSAMAPLAKKVSSPNEKGRKKGSRGGRKKTAAPIQTNPPQSSPADSKPA